MAAADKALLTDVLDCLSGAHQYLLQDLANERLSTQNQQKRQQYMQTMSGLMQRIQSSHPTIRPRMNTPGKMTHPPKPSAKPPLPVPVEEEEPQEVYEVPENNAENYLQFEPSNKQPLPPPPPPPPAGNDNDSQEEYLAMEADEDRIEEETYEEPQKMDEESQDLYEEAVPISLDPPSVTSPAPISPGGTFEPAGYMDPQKLNPNTPNNNDNKRASVIPDDMGDWELAYDQTNTKKKEKIKASNLKNVVMKGWLEKLGGRNQTSWQKRYCVLAGVFMYFYEKESGNTYNNRIPMIGFLPNPVPSLTRPKRKEYAFKLSSVNASAGAKKDYYFRSKSEEECSSWIEEIRKAGDLARGVMEKKKSMTMPGPARENTAIQEQRNRFHTSSASEEQENYEALEPVTEEIPQEDYVDVTPNQDDPQEDYVDLKPALLEEPQEDYVEASDVKLQVSMRSPMSTTPQMPLPPPPPSQSTNRPTLPPPPKSVLPPQKNRPVPRPDPVVDTTKVYEQNGNNNGIEYKNVYVILWDFMTQEADEINLKRGDLVLVSNAAQGQEWWFGEPLDENASRKIGPGGLFPSSYSSSAFELIRS